MKKKKAYLTHPKKERSPHWQTVRDKHLKENPKCEVCGSEKKLVAHHIKPFHLFPELELDPKNLMTLCESRRTFNCHLWVGHHGHFGKRYNPIARFMAVILWTRLFKRRKLILDV